MQAKIIASLANPKRLEIIHLLSTGPQSVSALTEMMGISQSNISQHLMVLRKVGVVKSTNQHQQRIYSLQSKHIARIEEAARRALIERAGLTIEEDLSKLQVYTDPICGMEVTAHTAVAHLSHQGKNYYFCAHGCEKKFKRNFSAQSGTSFPIIATTMERKL